MALLFVFAAAVNLNDPDPGPWVAFYLAAGAVAVYASLRPQVSPIPAVVVGTVALLWAVTVGSGVSQLAIFGRMFESWEMRNVQVEEAREASGLLIVAGWMAAIVIRQRMLARRYQRGQVGRA